MLHHRVCNDATQDALIEAYPDVVLACRVLACVACFGVVIVALTFTEPGFDDAGDSTVAGANALVLHSKPSQ